MQGVLPEVLDVAVRAARNLQGDICPTFTIIVAHNEDDPTFSDSEGAMIEKRVELIPPSLPALLTRAVLHFNGDLLPVTWADHTDCLDQLNILLDGPLLS